MRRKIRDRIVLALLTMLFVTTDRAQDSAESVEPYPGGAAAALHRGRRSPERDFVLNIASDQKALWTTPKQIRLEDAQWLLPLGAFSAGLFVGLAMIESIAIYCFVVAMILLFANPFWSHAIAKAAGG